MLWPASSALRSALVLALFVGSAAAAPAEPPAPPPAAVEPAAFAPLDLPDWVLREPGAGPDQPWILVVEDPQCPYCMQLHVALAQRRALGDPEIGRAQLARLPYPLPFHDQAAHVVEDAFCLEASGPPGGGGAAAYLDWLMVEPWRKEPGFEAASLEDLQKDGGFFDSRYEAHKVTSSRRRDYQTERARAEAACGPGACGGDEACAKPCADQAACRQACSTPPAGKPDAAATAAGEKCLSDCTEKFVRARYRQLSRVHSACLLADGPASAHARTAAAVAWAVAHDVPGTPTVYVGHPRVGFRRLGDSDDLAGFLKLLVPALAETRARLAAAPAAR